jgi:hypothetical protein
MVINDIDYSVYAELFCPDPSSPTGYGDPIQLGPTPIINVASVSCPYSNSGGQGGQAVVYINVGSGVGSVTFSYNGGGSIPDTFTLAGAVSFSITTAATGSVTLAKNTTDSIVQVSVSAPTAGTAWSYSISCVS